MAELSDSFATQCLVELLVSTKHHFL